MYNKTKPYVCLDVSDRRTADEFAFILGLLSQVALNLHSGSGCQRSLRTVINTSDSPCVTQTKLLRIAILRQTEARGSQNMSAIRRLPEFRKQCRFLRD